MVGPDGNLWFTDVANTPAIGRITPTGEITEFNGPMTNASDPQGLVAGPDNYLWFTDRGAIGRISLNGTITEFSAVPNANSEPGGLTLGPEGNVWFTEGGGTAAIGRITPTGEITEFTSGLNPNSKPRAIVLGPDGNLWFTDDGRTPAIGRVTPSGEITEFTAGLQPGNEPQSIVSGPDGNLWFAEGGRFSKAIDRITPAGTITEFTAGPGPECGLACGVFGLIPGPDGNLWFIDSAGPKSTIGRVTPEGDVTLFATGQALSESPQYLVSGGEGDIWFADVGIYFPGESASSSAIGRITPNGAVSQFETGLTTSVYPADLTLGSDGNIWFVDGNAIGRIITASEPEAATSPLSSTPSSTPTTRKISTIGAILLKRTRLTITAGGVTVIRVSCTSTSTCIGKLKLRVTTSVKHRKKPKTTEIAAVSFSIGPGGETTLKLRLNPTGRVMLKAHHHPMTATLSITRMSPPPVQTHSEKVTLTPQKAVKTHDNKHRHECHRPEA